MTNLPTWLAQLQFFTGLGFLLVFLLIELALAWVLFAFKLASHFAGRPEWVAAYRFWVRVFALSSVLVLAGIVPVILQFGSQWPGLMDKADVVVGPLLLLMMVIGVIFRSCFLGAMLFGQNKLSPWVHTCMVLMTALGITVTAWLGCVLLGWFLHPVGGEWVNGRYLVQSWPTLLRNTQAAWLFGLLLAMAALTAGGLMLGVVARQSLRHPVQIGELTGLRTGLVLGTAGWLLAVGLLAGYAMASASQLPARAAAIMGYWKNNTPAEWVVFAWPDANTQDNHAAWRVKGGEDWLARDEKGVLVGLERHSGMAPPVALVFWSARLTLLIVLVMGALISLAWWQLYKRKADLQAVPVRWRRTWAYAAYLGGTAALTGLACLLAGQMPYAVQGKVTLTEVAVPHSLFEVGFGLLLYCLVYGVLAAGFVRLLRHIAFYGVVPVTRHRGRA
ncbi:cytochrome ubiquinol oxidase subunit I [Pusillimonas sp. CC-YST705]|uniref:Cytochrome ubiquinol oxidase subunit I n=1 Tax=Mesopusillimonas faecipullorum TaxID=2755040 RepID=A0ABS8C8Z1_9BURK|nr:cytochrome ubiquinol oxidase subunit I [Mesopusillimonas faecipullorum]MCB5362490.1 cytochrome ubiquinol oxidase subunit I [Mesopusillimonas faecipullorum]